MVDVMVTNAGIAGPGSSVAAVDPAEWRQVIDVNLVGVFHTIQAALPHLKASAGYAMVVASIAAVIPGRWSARTWRRRPAWSHWCVRCVSRSPATG